MLPVQDPAALVERLRTDDIEVRQRAETELSRLGSAAESALDGASRDLDPEVASRARRLLLEVVAPHRREVDAAVAHLARHLRRAVLEPRPSAVAEAVRALGEIDPESWFDRGMEWHGLAQVGSPEHRQALARELTPELLLRELRYPRHSAWARMRERVLGAIGDSDYRRECRDCVARRLREVRIGIAFENARVEDILEYLRDVGDLSIAFGAGEFNLERAVTMEAKDVALGEALERVLLPFGLGARVMEEGVVLVEARPRACE